MNMDENLEMPVYSIWPPLLAVSLLLICIGIVSTIIISIAGILLLFASIIGWVWENRMQGGEEEEYEPGEG